MQELTKERISELKAKYGDVFLLEVEDKKCVLKAPDRKTLSMASTVGKNDPMKFNEVMLKNCWIDGDKEIQTNDSLFLAASQKLADLIEVKEASLSKL